MKVRLTSIEGEMERNETLLPTIDKELTELETNVNAHLQKMEFVW